MKEQTTPEQKVKRIIYLTQFLLCIITIAIFFLLRSLIHLPGVLAVFIAILIFMTGSILASRWLSKSKWKETLDIIEKEEEKKKEKPDWGNIAFVAFVCLCIAIGDGLNLLKQESGIFPNAISVLTTLTICAFIFAIVYNVRRGKIFSSANAKLIYGIACVIVVSVIMQRELWDSTPMVPDSNVAMFYYLIGAIISFLGKLFDIAVKMKEEQDLTI